MGDIEAYLGSLSKEVNERLSLLLPERELPQRKLYRAARYSLLAGGKRLRPALALATAEALGKAREEALNAACALELIHTYSLIHDDLPCMDDDDLRRGVPTLHKAYGEGIALLAGDYLLTYAFEVIANERGLSESKRLRLISTLAEAAGDRGMIGGQLLDIEAENEGVAIDRLKNIHRCKTGAMISASVAFGAIIAGAADEELALLKEFGYEIGLAFQIVDDLLDVTKSDQELGKTANSDIANNKSTYVTLLGLDGAKEAAALLLKSALSSLESLPLRGERLKEIALYIVERSR